MTLVSSIVRDAYRESNLIALGDEPSYDQRTEAMSRLQTSLSSVFGNEMGDPLTALPIGRNNIETPSGYPGYDNVPFSDWFAPLNVRLVLNVTATTTINLHPRPQDGSRLALQDLSDNLSTFPVTIVANGNLIEGSDTLVINESGFKASWFFRADLGSWERVSPLDWNDDFPFPEEFDDLFIASLAFRLNPRYGASTAPETVEAMTRVKRQFTARYKQQITKPVELGLIRTLGTGSYYDAYGESQDSESLFFSGIAIPFYLV